MQDRIPLYPGRVKMTPVAGQANTYDMVRADEPSQEGTPLNKGSLLKDSTAALFSLGTDAVPDDALRAIPDRMEPVGTVKTTVRTDLGDNWLLCNGDEINAATYPELAEMTGTISAGESSKYNDTDRLQARPSQNYCAFSASDGTKTVTVVHESRTLHFYISTDLVNTAKTSYTLRTSSSDDVLVGLNYVNGKWCLLIFNNGDSKYISVKTSDTAEEGSWGNSYRIGTSEGNYVTYAEIAYSAGYYVAIIYVVASRLETFFSSQSLEVNGWTAHTQLLKDASGNNCLYFGDVTADNSGNFFIVGRCSTGHDKPDIIFKFRPDTTAYSIVYTTAKYNSDNTGYEDIKALNWVNGRIIGYGGYWSSTTQEQTGHCRVFWSDDSFATAPQVTYITVPWVHYSYSENYNDLRLYGKVYKFGKSYVVAAVHYYAGSSSNYQEIGLISTDDLSKPKWTMNLANCLRLSCLWKYTICIPIHWDFCRFRVFENGIWSVDVNFADNCSDGRICLYQSKEGE